MICPSARPSRYSSSVIQPFSWIRMRRIQKFTPPKPEAPMRANVRKMSLALRGSGTDASLQLVQDNIGEDHQHRDEQRPSEQAGSRKPADPPRAPYGHRGVDAAHRTALMPDEPGADKADPDHDLSHDTRRTGRIIAYQHPSDHLRGCA